MLKTARRWQHLQSNVVHPCKGLQFIKIKIGGETDSIRQVKSPNQTMQILRKKVVIKNIAILLPLISIHVSV